MLDENIRNTRQIAQVFGSLGAGQARYRGMDGPPARFVPCTPQEAIRRADSEVDRLLGQGWEPGQIALPAFNYNLEGALKEGVDIPLPKLQGAKITVGPNLSRATSARISS